MAQVESTIDVRLAKPSDAAELCALLNEIIAAGGTTAFETPLTAEKFASEFLQSENHICCFIAENGAGLHLGFQVLLHDHAKSGNWADIATFSRLTPRTPGVGTALFAPTKSLAQQSGIKTINATIRADNTGGLAYYEKMGFQTYAVDTAKPLQDGTPVDRISKRYLID